ncbi:unnamed protein product [Meganyctiphanes norvegica]|uniref:UDP-D-xylose:beta-D-glucoside alpha-1,3-D-xylosyltransferase n=1 Tax=Meganyctiphanes norvegica TaxID=48144 RepID=A0AAV2PVJ3_MEGNR
MLCFCLLQFYNQQDGTNVDTFKRVLDPVDSAIQTHGEANSNRGENVTFIIIMCSGKPKKNMKVNQEQMKQFTVLLKSAAMLTRTILRFHIIADTDKIQDSISSITTKWPEEYSNRLVFEYHKLAYPPGYEKIRNMYLPCATQRLFLPDMFSEMDAAIYVDTDAIFLRRPEELWEEFNKFDDMQLAAIGPTSFYRLAHLKVPYYRPGGLNPGIMMMNLTRMRHYPLGSIPVKEGWSTAMLGIVNAYQGRLQYADMDILNIFFNQNPRLLYPLGCWWNFLMTHCKKQSPCLPHMASENRGVALLHGAGDVFIRNIEKKLKVVFKVFEKYNIGSPVNGILTPLKLNLSASVKSSSSYCDQVENIDDLLTMELKKHK